MTQTRAEWLLERKRGIGGSDAAGVLSLPPYHCARRLWYDKRSVPEDYPQLDKAVFERGHKLEPIVREMFSEATDNVVIDARAIAHPDYPVVRGNADGLYCTQEINNKIALGKPVSVEDYGILEIKTVNQRVFLNLKRDGLPPAWLMQMQHYLAVYGRRKGEFAVLWPDGWLFLTFPVKRDETFINDLILAEEKFWRKVENGPAPDSLDIGDKRCRDCAWRLTCLGEDSLDLPPAEYGEDIPDVSEETGYAKAVRDYLTAKEIADEATQMMAENADTLKQIIGDKPAVKGAGVKIYYRPQETKRFDTKGFRVKHPEFDNDYLKTTKSRPFRMYLKGGN